MNQHIVKLNFDSSLPPQFKEIELEAKLALSFDRKILENKVSDVYHTISIQGSQLT